ncbi:hypothetical protein [Thauera sp. WH-1]|uniref:hypothetical protein n=1 Tax=Thauera sp. WH-1 TaxID=3398230 RepID=UPI0039FD1350
MTVTLFERLHAHRHLVAEAYHQGSVLRTDDNRRAIEILQQQRVLVPHSPDEYRLHSSLRRFLASAFSSHRILQSSGDIGAIFAHLEKLTDFYIAAFNEDDQAATDSYEDEISQTVFEINDSLQGFITNLQANIETRFAAVTSLAAKKLQNEFYLAATHTLVQVLESFHLSDLLERIQAFPRIETLLRTQLFARIPVFRSTLQTIYETLRQFLFEFRKIEARAKRIQQMWLFLKKTPDYEPRAWDNASDLPAWLERSPGLPIATHPDVSDTACEDTLVELAQSIKADQSPRKRREAGALTAEEVPAKVIVKVPAHVLALRQMLKDAKASEAPVSVRQWRNQHATELELDDTLWLELALDVLAKKTSITKGLEVGYNEHSREGPFSTGNILIKDLSLWKSA